MKKQLLALIVFLFSVSYAAQAQYTYEPFRVDVGGGFSATAWSAIGVGFLANIEPKYEIKNFSFGTRLGINHMLQITYENGDFIMPFNFNWLGTFDYHFTSGKARPFVGCGLGIYVLSSYIDTSDYVDHDDYYNDYYDYGYSGWDSYGAKFGGMIRGGIDVKHLRLALEYNIIGRSEIYVGNGYHYDVRFNYLGICISGIIGGGRIK